MKECNILKFISGISGPRSKLAQSDIGGKCVYHMYKCVKYTLTYWNFPHLTGVTNHIILFIVYVKDNQCILRVFSLGGSC